MISTETYIHQVGTECFPVVFPFTKALVICLTDFTFSTDVFGSSSSCFEEEEFSENLHFGTSFTCWESLMSDLLRLRERSKARLAAFFLPTEVFEQLELSDFL